MKDTGIKIVENKNDTSIGEIYIYGYITDEKWYTEDVTPKEFKEELDKLKTKKSIDVYINSGGGGVWAGMAIYNMLKRFPGTTTGHVDGVAASIASVILQGCQKRICAANGLVMIHNPSTFAAGDSSELRKTADLLDLIKKTIIATYSEKANTDKTEISSMMDAETWMTGEEAVAFGFADALDNASPVTMCIDNGRYIINGQNFDRSKYAAFPVDKIPAVKKPFDTSVYDKEIEFNESLLKLLEV